MRPRAARVAAALAVLPCAAALAGCGGAPAPATAASPSPERATAGTQASADVGGGGGGGVDVAAGAVAVAFTVRGVPAGVPGVAVAPPDDDGARSVTVDPVGLPGDRPGDVPVELTLEVPGSFALHADGSLAVLDGTGTTVGGLSAPTGGAAFALSDAARASLAVPAGAPVTTVVGSAALGSATWGDREGGRSLAVVPTDWARAAGQAGRETVWDQLVAAVPEADTTVMHDQLVCHAVGAPDKAEWNLEPWRPDVGLVAVLAAACNPR